MDLFKSRKLLYLAVVLAVCALSFFVRTTLDEEDSSGQISSNQSDQKNEGVAQNSKKNVSANKEKFRGHCIMQTYELPEGQDGLFGYARIALKDKKVNKNSFCLRKNNEVLRVRFLEKSNNLEFGPISLMSDDRFALTYCTGEKKCIGCQANENDFFSAIGADISNFRGGVSDAWSINSKEAKGNEEEKKLQTKLSNLKAQSKIKKIHHLKMMSRREKCEATFADRGN